MQDVAQSFCAEAETQMRIADRRIFLKWNSLSLSYGMLHVVQDKEQTEIYFEGNANRTLPNVWSFQDFPVYKIGVNNGYVFHRVTE